MARQLEKEKEEVAFLALLDSFAPQISNNVQSFSLDSEKALAKYLFNNTSICEEINDLNDESELWFHVIERLEGQKEPLENAKTIIPKDISNIPGFKELDLAGFVYYLNVIRSLSNAKALYIPLSKVQAPVYFFDASIDDMISDRDSNIQTWNLYCEKPIHQIKVQADHFSMYEPPHINILAELINMRIRLI